MTMRWIVDCGVVDSCEVRFRMKLKNGDFSFPLASSPAEILGVWGMQLSTDGDGSASRLLRSKSWQNTCCSLALAEAVASTGTGALSGSKHGGQPWKIGFLLLAM